MVDLWGSMVGGVDIGTEWNLKLFSHSQNSNSYSSRYRNRVEFKV